MVALMQKIPTFQFFEERRKRRVLLTDKDVRGHIRRQATQRWLCSGVVLAVASQQALEVGGWVVLCSPSRFVEGKSVP